MTPGAYPGGARAPEVGLGAEASCSLDAVETGGGEASEGGEQLATGGSAGSSAPGQGVAFPAGTRASGDGSALEGWFDQQEHGDCPGESIQGDLANFRATEAISYTVRRSCTVNISVPSARPRSGGLNRCVEAFPWFLMRETHSFMDGVT